MENFKIFKQFRDKSNEYYDLWKKAIKNEQYFIESLSFDEICKIVLMIMKINNYTNYSNKNEFTYFLYDNNDCNALMIYGNIHDYDIVYDYVIKNIK